MLRNFSDRRATPRHSVGGFWLQWLLAMLLTLALLALLVLYKTGQFNGAYRTLGVLTLLGSIPVYSLARVYQSGLGLYAGLTRVLSGWAILVGVLIAIAFITQSSRLYSREALLLWITLSGLAQALSYIVLSRLYRRYAQARRSKRRVLIIGTGEDAQQLADKITRERQEPIQGLVTSGSCYLDADKPPRYPVLGSVVNLRALINEHQVTRLYIALPLQDAEQIEGLFFELMDMNIDVIWVPNLGDMLLLNHGMHDIDGTPAIHLNESPLSAYPAASNIKALLDRSIALLMLLLLSPLLATVALLIKLGSPGPVIFKQQRHGRDGQIIQVWKFRSMRPHPGTQVKQASRSDPRITPIGRFIRRTSIDELPQLINVLQGRMSLVGPRPHAVEHNDYYANKITAYMARHRIRPGITGLAQVSGCRGATETVEKMRQRVELDLAYINNWSVWLDIKILLKTPLSLLSKDVY
jgi:putative colanic acid biosynthesis UDP-glucose lipid carrier transferase